ncbi:MAG: flagellar hook assembly protein FlgD [Hyphomicrobiales bacterium]|nr:flagellar hook assembly protein FlgD [Hyphomicrobiales bacterium]
MSPVSAIAASDQANASAQTTNKANVDYDAFLNLLVAQLKYQDPTEPTDPAQFMAQLASFSSVEQQIQTNEKLDALVMSNLFGQASSLIGRTVTSADRSQSGVVASVTLVNGSLTATLADGTGITMGDGVVVSQ